MAPHDLDALSALLEEAAALPPEARAAFFDNACDGNASLREELASLLAAHEAGAPYFERVTERIIGPALAAFAHDVADEFSTGQTIGKYRLLERLGAGGMGIVFKALDLRLDRLVALKFLPAHLSTDAHAKARLIAEAKTASALDHPNIGVVHDVGETSAGRLFIVMGYYEGETLECRIERGRISDREALDVVKQIANALMAAHVKRIIHRDVKPSNIIVTKDGTVKLLDFGIAKLAELQPAHEGGTPGTVAYMSPEQTRGEAIDHRTDLWSLGVVLYEMLTGVRPFRADTHQNLISAIRHDAWKPVGSSRVDVSENISCILQRCLAKDPDSRYGSARELLTALEALDTREGRARKSTWSARPRWRFALVAGIAALVAAITVPRIVVNQGSQFRPTRLAVLPFVSASSATEERDLADGVTKEIISNLSRIGILRVIARSSVMQYRGSGKSVTEVGRELGVDTVLAGRLRSTNGTLEIALRLVDAGTQQQLWTRNYTATFFTLQSVERDIVLDVAEALRVQVPSTEQGRLSQAGTMSADAYVLYLKGRHVLEKRNVEAAKQAQEYFEQALDLDPGFAKAWVGLGDTFSVLSALAAVRAADAYARTRAAAERALQIEPDLSEAHVCLATALSLYYWDFDGAARHYRRAIELNPSDADAHRLYAEHLRFDARFDEALGEAREAEALDPLSSAPQIVAGTILYWAGRYDQAIAEYHRILEVNPRFTYAYFFMALAQIQKHEYDKAREALSVPGAGSPLQQESLTAYIDAIDGRSAAARNALDRLERLSREQNISPWHSAIIHLALGEHDRAMDLIEQAYQARDWQVRMLPVEPLLDPLRSNPRFAALAARMRGQRGG